MSLRLQATCLLVGEGALLIRGPAGSGKTSLCLALIDLALIRGTFARLVCDDGVIVRRIGSRLVARAHPAIAGLVERRGLGLVPCPHEVAGCVRLIVDCTPKAPPRLPEPADLVAEIDGVVLPRLQCARGAGDAAWVLAALSLFAEPA
ncbi:MAG: HPr kinase/phosphatase C-terminal domain-containing protein [Hyphomicrobiales bacterium]|jgi:HPr kinase/phosphorylase|nr:HPr kinase/phosphatase C-terminal domain-containing protein [Hyphomicrobiales bacterium]